MRKPVRWGQLGRAVHFTIFDYCSAHTVKMYCMVSTRMRTRVEEYTKEARRDLSCSLEQVIPHYEATKFPSTPHLFDAAKDWIGLKKGALGKGDTLLKDPAARAAFLGGAIVQVEEKVSRSGTLCMKIDLCTHFRQHAIRHGTKH